MWWRCVGESLWAALLSAPPAGGPIPYISDTFVYIPGDWVSRWALNTGSVRPTQGRVVCLAQVNGGSQSFNAVNAMRLLARWMRMPRGVNQRLDALATLQNDVVSVDNRLEEPTHHVPLMAIQQQMVREGRYNPNVGIGRADVDAYRPFGFAP